MSEARVWEDGDRTVRVYGLDETGASVASALFELETIIWNGVQSGNAALVEWRGRHSEMFVEDANEVLGKLGVLVDQVRKAKRVLQAWPSRPGRPTLDIENARPPQLVVPSDPGTSSADPAALDDFRFWCEDAVLRVPGLTSSVNLDSVTADVTSTHPDPLGLDIFEPRWPREESLLDVLVDPPIPETYSSDPALHVDLPNVSGGTTTFVDQAGVLGAWTGVVAVAFLYGDPRLIDLIVDYPGLADELLAGFTDGQLGGDSSLVVVLAYFDVLDADGDGDGRISLDELSEAAIDPELRPYVTGSAQYLIDNPQLRWLVDTMNNGMDYSSDVAGSARDDQISREDITTFLEFNDQLEVLEQNFDAFDTAAHPDQAADGDISRNDLEAMADSGDHLGDAAQRLLDHGGALTRLEYYEDAKPGFLGPVGAPQAITAASVTLLTVDQQVYADRPAPAGSFVDRNFETLMGPELGNLASPDGMRSVFTTALTESEDRAARLDRVIAEVADDGAIHNTGLPMTFADGTAANMDVIDENINAAAEAGSAMTDQQRRDYLDTHDFLHETSRDPDAANRLREGLFEYGIEQTTTASNHEQGRTAQLRDLGAVTEVLDHAQHNALTGAALDDLREAMEDGRPSPTPGSITDYGLSHLPVAGTLNDIADGMGLSGGDGVEWLLEQLPDEVAGKPINSADTFAEQLDDADRATAVRAAEQRISWSLWLVNERYPLDEDLRAAAQGQPFVDEHGAIKTALTTPEAQALREWATSMIDRDGLLRSDYDVLQGAAGDVDDAAGALPSLGGRR